MAELYVLEHFVDKGAIDLSGKNFGIADGISPKHEIYDVRSFALACWHLTKTGLNYYMHGEFLEIL